MKDLLYGHDDKVAAWTQHTFNINPRRYEMAVGILENGQLVGSILWHAFRGHDIEISYYGPNTMTLGIARHCARVAVDHFKVSRVTARTEKTNKMMTRGVRKIGFQYEGVVHSNRDEVMYGLYGKHLARLAGKELH